MVIKVFAQTMATHIPELRGTRLGELNQTSETKKEILNCSITAGSPKCFAIGFCQKSSQPMYFEYVLYSLIEAPYTEACEQPTNLTLQTIFSVDCCITLTVESILKKAQKQLCMLNKRLLIELEYRHLVRSISATRRSFQMRFNIKNGPHRMQINNFTRKVNKPAINQPCLRETWMPLKLILPAVRIIC